MMYFITTIQKGSKHAVHALTACLQHFRIAESRAIYVYNDPETIHLTKTEQIELETAIFPPPAWHGVYDKPPRRRSIV